MAGNVDTLLEDTECRMMDAVEAMERDFAGLRTGKASPALVEGLTVEYYGASTRVRDIANITSPEPRLLVIQPWDPNALRSIEKAIQASDLGISPVGDGRVIRLPIPELSEERRKELSKLVHQRAETARVEVRNMRREANDAARKAQKASAITEDDLADMTKDVQEVTDKYIEEINTLMQAKEEDLMQV